ncbi:unnamed protein product [Mytilus coruscus]|uniref:Uncharacterized protein n=1 Tax=Mytilus coruscus TaxID=42192 RepID=A0A6J8ARF4_MYTCO|nr:unnamed protein product [Mytilus coruscus]
MHKRQLSLLYSILASENTKLKNLIERQMTVNAGNSDSFFSRTQEILKYYNLPTVSEFKDQMPTKTQWKKDINRTIANKWSTILQEEMKEKSTLKRCNTQICPALNEKRQKVLPELKQQIVNFIGQNKWHEHFMGNKELLEQTIIDCTLLEMNILNINQESAVEIEKISRKLCYNLHVTRTLLHQRLVVTVQNVAKDPGCK